MNRCLLSVIIPCYNVDNYITDCFNSVLINIPSHLKQEIEIIIINDGSTDSTLERIKTLITKNEDFNIIFINKKNEGLSAARNDGLDIANGKYIAFLDSDDIWLHNMKNILNQLESINCDIIEFNATRFSDNHKIDDKKSIYTYMKNREHYDIETYQKIIFQHSLWMVWSRIYKSNLLKNMKFPIGKNYEDILFTSQCYLSSKNILTIDKIALGYRIAEKSITSNPTKKEIDSILWVLDECFKKYENNKDEISFLLLANTWICMDSINFIVNDILCSESSEKLNNFKKNITKSLFFHNLPLLKRFKIKHNRTFNSLKKIIKNVF
ncbi:glycosyltransferase family 2 protein [Xenorhabdus bovienii]|uniref:glycosyltransferase family 2 protein n=1 Tax=Xenorhabdus bovienii TaxID=40576 RepID=UPI0023B33A69|nr:glycosyltransferase family 2 protein [Xenorhabdus bovienii]MDE9563764.1 glycosyltransferase family 2 protein [Xenorhabdus bovienii]